MKSSHLAAAGGAVAAQNASDDGAPRLPDGSDRFPVGEGVYGKIVVCTISL